MPSDQQMIQTMQKIGGLLFRRIYGDLDESEQITLEEWLDQRDAVSRQFFEDITEWGQIQDALQAMYQFDEEAALKDIQKKILALNGILENDHAGQVYEPRNTYGRYYIAAALVLLIAGAVFFFIQNRKTDISQQPLAQRYHNDVAPGGNKAILELADGSKLTLDNASDGELVRQGASKVVKLEDGKLAYKESNISSAAANEEGRISSNTTTIRYNKVSTPKGGQYQVQLPDGTQVWLNAASSIRFPTTFTGKSRTVELAGEAYFQVASNAVVPFKVNIAGSTLQLEVLGTEFDIMAYSDETERATLVDGSIKVITAGNQSVLKPGQQAVAKDAGSKVLVRSDVNMEEVTAWKDGRFQFQDASIQDIMRQVGRWYDVDITYQGEVKQQFVGKIPRKVPVSILLKILESTGWVHFVIDGKKITVSP